MTGAARRPQPLSATNRPPCLSHIHPLLSFVQQHCLAQSSSLFSFSLNRKARYHPHPPPPPLPLLRACLIAVYHSLAPRNPIMFATHSLLQPFSSLVSFAQPFLPLLPNQPFLPQIFLTHFCPSFCSTIFAGHFAQSHFFAAHLF